MKRFLLSAFFVISFSLVFAENFGKDGYVIDLNGLYYDYGMGADIKFSEGKIIIRDYENGLKENNYVVSSKNVNLKTDSKISYVVYDTGEKFLILANPELLVLYGEDQKAPKIIGTNMKGMDELIDYINPKMVNASSELQEGNYIYTGDNISNINLSECWVEGVSGNGIGETISFNGNCTFLYLFNGYVSFEKPYLYEANSRLKKIEISFPEEKNKDSIVIELNDTPNPQKIDLGFRCNSKVKIKILDVYDGKKFSDTCLSGIIMKVY